MSATISRFSFCVVLMASLAGCGGSSGGSGGCGSNCGGGGGKPTVVTYTFTGTTPTAVATKIGSGAYTQATLASGNLSISLPSGTTNYSVAWVCPPLVGAGLPAWQDFASENVIEATVQDGTLFSQSCQVPFPAFGTATVQVNASAIAGGETVALIAGDDSGYAGNPWSSSTLNLSGQFDAGTYDVFVVVEDAAANMLAVKTLRNQTIPGVLNGGNTVVFQASDLTAPQMLTINNVPPGFFVTGSSVDYETSPPGNALILNVSAGLLTQYTALSSGAMQSGDYYKFDASAGGVSALNSSVSDYVAVEIHSSTAAPETMNLPAPWPYAGPTAAALPTFTFSYAGFSGMTDIEQEATIDWSQGNTSEQIQMTATANYQNGATSMTIPDLSGLTGFLAPAPSGTKVGWSASISQGFALLASPTNGTLPSVMDDGWYTAP
jgi:hypothetical protein